MKNKLVNSPLSLLMDKKLEGLSESESMQLIGLIIDIGGDEKWLAALDHASNLLDQFLESGVSATHACRCHYFRANIWSARRRASSDWQAWVWKSEFIDGELLELRKALRHQGFADLEPVEQAQIYTNLGNILSEIGRFIEAVESWDSALAAVPKYAMASGNRGFGLKYYAEAVFDSGHRGILMVAASESLADACAEDDLDIRGQKEAFDSFVKELSVMQSDYNILKIANCLNCKSHSMGRGNKERDYRKWCLNNRLFINPLNDIGPNPIAAHDVMTLPSITWGVDQGPCPPAIIHYFNIIKQEFCAARFALYEGIVSAGVHFSDRGVLLYNTLDYPAFGFAVERIKMAFRGAYAVFDKTAFFLNSYLNLGHPERQVNFRNLWSAKGKGVELHPKLDGMANWPLRGLFWLSKDIFEENFRQVTEPDAQALYELRNHMEHKFVSVHDHLWSIMPPDMIATPKAEIFDISFSDLTVKTLRQLKIARAVIIYLSLSVHAEEQRRSREHDHDRLIMPMILDAWDDDWKYQS